MKSLQQDGLEKTYAVLTIFASLPTREKFWLLIFVIQPFLLRYKLLCIIQQGIDLVEKMLK